MPDISIIVTEGGPYPGAREVDETQYPWPLPGILGASGGVYVKVREEFIAVRTAYYRWYSQKELEEATNAKAEDR